MSANTFKIEKLKNRSLDGVLALYNDFNARNFTRKQFSALLNKTKNNDFVFVALLKRDVVGYLIVKIHASIESGGILAEIKDFYVALEHRGKGIGSALLVKALKFCKKYHPEEIVLLTKPKFKTAHHLYQKNGFKKTNLLVFQKKR